MQKDRVANPGVILGAVKRVREVEMFKVVKVKKDESKRGNGTFYWVFLKDLENGKSAKTYVGDRFGNWARWERVVRAVLSGKEIILDKLLWKDQKKRVIDADSWFVVVQRG